MLRRAARTYTGKNHRMLLKKPLLRGDDRETRRRMQALEQLEDRIREQEKSIQRLTGELKQAGEAQAFDKAHRVSWQLAKAQVALDVLMQEWEKLAV